MSGTTITAGTQFTGPGTGLTGTAGSLNIGGTAALASGLTGTPSIAVGTIASAGITDSSGITTTGDVVAYYSASDDRLKNKLGKIENALEKVQALNGFMFKYNDLASQFGFETESIHVGLSAQEVASVLPEVVKELPFENMHEYLRIQYEKIVPLLVEAIKELAEEVRYLSKPPRVE